MQYKTYLTYSAKAAGPTSKSAGSSPSMLPADVKTAGSLEGYLPTDVGGNLRQHPQNMRFFLRFFCTSHFDLRKLR